MKESDKKSFFVPKQNSSDNLQDTFVESREPLEMYFCFILFAIYLGLVLYCWEPLAHSHKWVLFFYIEGFLITITVLALFLGIRPYLSPSYLQINKVQILYRDPYFFKERILLWEQIIKMYVSPELIFILYRLPNKPKSIRTLFIHSRYLTEHNKIADSILQYSSAEPIFLSNPGIITRCIQGFLFFIVFVWILRLFIG